MTATKTEAPTEVEGTGYEKTLHGDDEINYAKEHADGRVTTVNINWEFHDCVVRAGDISGDEELGAVDVATVPAGEDRTQGIDTAVEWMQANPNGVDL